MHSSTTADVGTSASDEGFWRPLLHRWLVEYNPLYIFSALLVLGGMILLSRGLATEGSRLGQVGVAAIAELYAFALIGGAALLVRIEQRRPAVMLAFLTALYQGDLTLHTETCPNLGAVGSVAACVWLLLFVAKLHALAWAMRLRLSRAAAATATLGALGLALFPYWLPTLPPRLGSALVAVWLVLLASLKRHVESRLPLEGRAATVLVQALATTWGSWAVLLGLHVVFWGTQRWLNVASLLPLVPILGVRRMRREAHVWIVAVATLAFVRWAMPSDFALVAFVVAVVLAERARVVARLARHGARGHVPEAVAVGPYRFATSEDAPRTRAAAIGLVPIGHAAAMRLYTGAAGALYLSAWTLAWSGGPWPPHVVALDAVFVVALAIGGWKLRALVATLPAALSAAHLVVELRLLPGPPSTAVWGGLTIGLGFAVLAGSLAATYRLTRSAAPKRSEGLRGVDQ